MDILTEFGSSVVAETGNSLLAKVKKHIGYLFSYNNNIKTLEVSQKNLNIKISDADRVTADAGTSFKTVSSTVTHWKKEADKLQQDAHTIISLHANNTASLCPNPWSRYSASKNAWEMTQQINQNVQNAPDFGTTFDLPAPYVGSKFNLTGVAEFESRSTLLDGVLEALKDEKVSMCSMCGMGGVGKTTLAKKLVQRVEADHLFGNVAMVTVSQSPNLQAIQDEIIELVGLKINEQTMTARANRLSGWLAEHKTLLVLDDVWWKLDDEDFEAVGIPLASKRCKIVLTSRNEDECIKMGSKHNFRIGVLEDAEAWNLFREKADISTQDLNLHETARNIAYECGGLPIAIVTIGTALYHKPLGILKDSLLKLQTKSKIDPLNVYSRIQLSYDLLNDDEAKSCFRLCCLYPEDYNIPVDDLVFYGKGLQIFDNVDTMSQARDRVESIIHKLKKTFFLLDGDLDECVKMHDIIRDFAISISSEHYLVKFTASIQWPEKREYENCSAISFMSREILGHPVYLECPKLKLLQLTYRKSPYQLLDNLFEGTKELQVLSLNVQSLEQSLDAVLKELRTLCVREIPHSYREGRIPSQIGNLLHENMINLEVLSISTIRKCDDLLAKIGFLCGLRFLDLSHVEFAYIPPGTFSKLVKLEELYLSWTFTRWGYRQEYGEGIRMNASLNEIESLPLNAIKIGISKGSILAEKLVRNLTRSSIFFGSSYCDDFVSKGDSKQAVEIYNVEASDIRESRIGALLGKCERLRLTEVRNLKNIFCQLIEEDSNRFGQLKEIYIKSCDEIEYLFDNAITERITRFSELEVLMLSGLRNLKAIICFMRKIEEACFSNLTELEIEFCYKLKHVFPLSVCRELRQLQIMKVRNCNEMQEIFYNDRAGEENDDQVVSSSNVEAEPELQLSPKPTLDHRQKTTTCPNPCSIIPRIFGRDKQSISVPSYHQVEENIPKCSEKEVDDAIIFPQLKILRLEYMCKLRILYEGNHAIETPSLQELIIDQCNNMEALSYGSFKAPRLGSIEINYIKYLVEGDLNAIVKKVVSNQHNTLDDDDGDE